MFGDDCNFSHILLDKSDFNNSALIIIFEPDENVGAGINQVAAPIPIVDDPINEADEQMFVVELHLTDSINPDLIDLTTRPASLCTITDDDSKHKNDM